MALVLSNNALLTLPQELFLEIIQYLNLSSVHQLGAVCKDLHQKIHQNEELWFRRVRFELKLFIIDPDYSGSINSDHWKIQPKGVIQDPIIQGAKETYLLYFKEFQSFQRKRKNPKSEWPILPYLPYFNNLSEMSNFSSKLALLGPGIESTRTKHLVHKLVNAHDDCLNVIGMVPSTTGGFGSAIQIDFKKLLYSFELICLYSNSQRIRENQNQSERLLASNNRLLAKDVDFVNQEGPWFNENILKLFPTLNGLIFAVDAQETEFVHKELEVLLHSLDDLGSQMPVLILYCVAASDLTDVDLIIQTKNLNLVNTKRPWGLFKVNIATLEGVDLALTWILYHNQKQIEELRFHKKSAQP